MFQRTDFSKNKKYQWCYEDGLTDYLKDSVKDYVSLPEEPFVGSFTSQHEAADIFYSPKAQISLTLMVYLVVGIFISFSLKGERRIFYFQHSLVLQCPSP